MPTLAEDRRYLEAALAELKNYLLSDVLFYPLTAPMPRLTIGGMLLAQRRLHAQKSASPLDFELDTLRTKWRAAWEKKSAKELDARLTLWRNYLNDYRNDENQADHYRHEVRWRVMSELLLDEISQGSAELVGLDQLLRAKFQSGEFIWNDTLKREFPQDKFWFLYGKLE